MPHSAILLQWGWIACLPGGTSTGWLWVVRVTVLHRTSNARQADPRVELLNLSLVKSHQRQITACSLSR